MTAEQAIGVFDSGVGGLSVLAHIRRQLPHEALIYVADSAYMPYGCKPESVVRRRCLDIASFLTERRCKAIVVACNTATAAAVQQMRERFDGPVIGMEPAVKPAVLQSASGVVGVLATRVTAGSEKFRRLAARFADRARVIVQPCPGLVEHIEVGDLDGGEMRALLQGYLQPLLRQGADTLVLGCTHYPFIAPLIRELAGEQVAVIDSGAAVARELARQLAMRDRLAEPASAASPVSASRAAPLLFRSSDAQAISESLMSRLWGEKVTLRPMTSV